MPDNHRSHLTLLALAAVLSARCGAPPAPPPNLQEIPVGAPSVGATQERTFVGKVQAVRYVEFRARHKGVVEQLGVDEGQPVRAGQLLFSISAKTLEQELRAARAAAEVAEAESRAAEVELGNVRLLAEKQVISNSELEQAVARQSALAAKVREARANADRAALELDLAQVEAPFPGVVNRLPKKVGSIVLEDELLTSLSDTSEVLVYFKVPEQEYLEHSPQVRSDRRLPVTLRLANGSPYPHPGVIDAVESEIDPETGTIAFRARFPNPEGTLVHGATGQVILHKELPDVLTVPQAATFEIQDKVYVYRVTTEGTIRAAEISTKGRSDDAFLVGSGLSPHDRIVLAGVQRLRDGEQILPRAQTSVAFAQ